MRTFLVVLLTALLTLIGGWVALQEGLIPSTLFSGQEQCTSTTVVKTYEEGECAIEETWDDCTTPWWTTATHWDVVLSFESSSATLTEWCISKSSVCNNGSYMNDNDPYNNESCELETPLNCDVNGFVFAHGTSELFYEEWVAKNGKVKCNSEARSCEDGEATGWDTYIYKSCYAPGWACDAEIVEEEIEEVAPVAKEIAKPVVKTAPRPTAPVVQETRQANCPSPFGWRRWEPGQSWTAYTTSSVAYGGTCSSVSITCAYWSIRYWTKDAPWAIVSWNISASCTVWDPAPCSSACGTVAHAAQVTTYTEWLIPHWSWRICADVQVTSTCTNGSLSPNAWTACTCEVAPPTPCVAPNGQTVSHGSSLTLYKYPQVQALPWDGIDVCERQWRECTNGQFYDWNGNRKSFDFQHQSCVVLDPPAGWGPGGQWIPQG